MVTCSDGSFYPDSHTGSHGWVLASADKAILLQGAGPGDGHPKLMSSYRSELGGLLAVLYLIHCICHHYQVQGGQLKYHCDNRGVLKNVFSPATPGIAPYLQADADLVMEARRLLSIIPVTIIAEWVKGHYSGKEREFKHDLNEIADSLATSFNSVPHPNFKPRLQPIAHPHYGARILYEGSTITNKLRYLMAQALHRPALVSHLIRKNKWEERTFHLVHWDAHEMAFKRLTSSCQITTAKLIHDLVNTNVQNYRYYNKSPKCPCCLTVDETFHHVLSCASTTAAEYRDQALKQLQKDLKSINTPSEVVDALSHGTTMWLKRQIDSDCTVRASTVGSIKGTDILLTMAFNEQFHKIGWHNLFNGRISKLWGRAVLQLTKSSYSSLSTTWSAQTILYLWKYTRSIWINRNQVVHGKTDQEMANKIRESIHTKVRQLYETFQSTPNFILSRHQYLFTNRSLAQRLNLDIDSLQCWLSSVDSAQQDLEHHKTSLRLQSNRFFAPFYAIGRARHRTNTSSTDSTYSPSLQETTTTLYDTDSLGITQGPSENDTISMTDSSHSSLVTTTSASTLGTFISNGSSDPPSIISWSTSSEQLG
jgi:hypothetical protein